MNLRKTYNVVPKCIICGRLFLSDTSKMFEICPECRRRPPILAGGQGRKAGKLSEDAFTILVLACTLFVGFLAGVAWVLICR